MSDERTDRAKPASKTRRKQEMHARQEIGEALVGLTEAQLAQLELPEKLLDAVLLARRIRKFGALRRQLQYVGRLMRDVDAAAISARLEAWKGASREAAVRLHRLERWRDRLIAEDGAMAELAAACPGCDLQRLRVLVRKARHEQALGSAPNSARELFQALKAALPDGASANAGQGRAGSGNDEAGTPRSTGASGSGSAGASGSGSTGASGSESAGASTGSAGASRTG